MTAYTYPAMAPLTTLSAPADKMFLLVSGAVSMMLADGTVITSLRPGESFGGEVLLGETEWKFNGISVQYVSLCNVMVETLSFKEFVPIVRSYGGDIEARVIMESKSYLNHVLKAIDTSDDECMKPEILKWQVMATRILKKDKKEVQESFHSFQQVIHAGFRSRVVSEELNATGLISLHSKKISNRSSGHVQSEESEAQLDSSSWMEPQSPESRQLKDTLGNAQALQISLPGHDELLHDSMSSTAEIAALRKKIDEVSVTVNVSSTRPPSYT